MTQDEIDTMWQQAMKESIKDGEMYTRYHFAKLVAERALADPMCEVQRLGQEIEQKIGCVNHDCDQCKAQPEQEPVIGKWSLREVYFDEDGEPISHRSPPQRTEQPAQRTWVGLTEQDLDYLCNLAYTGDEEFALAVQAKLMEKNA
jgi:hypothetical protein